MIKTSQHIVNWFFASEIQLWYGTGINRYLQHLLQLQEYFSDGFWALSLVRHFRSKILAHFHICISNSRRRFYFSVCLSQFHSISFPIAQYRLDLLWYWLHCYILVDWLVISSSTFRSIWIISIISSFSLSDNHFVFIWLVLIFGSVVLIKLLWLTLSKIIFLLRLKCFFGYIFLDFCIPAYSITSINLLRTTYSLSYLQESPQVAILILITWYYRSVP